METPDSPPRPARRWLILGAATAAATLSWGVWLSNRGERWTFEPVPDLPGFRRIPAGPVTANPFAGLDAATTAPADPREVLGGDICGALYPGGWADTTPIAVFTDYNCPICRRVEDDLMALERSSRGAIRLDWHELPLLGPTSVAASRAALAAREQGAYDAFRARLMRSHFQLDDTYLHTVAGGMGLDPDRLLSDAAGPDVDATLARSRALADLFGIPGTPAFVIGRTLVVGALPRRDIADLVALEAQGGMEGVCYQMND